MRFHALLPVRDEADILGQSLAHLLAWADAIYVFDTGSVDESWEIVQDFAARDERVIPLKKEPVYFSEQRVRGWIFNQARASMNDGDWFLRVDADEFHHVAPPEFVRTQLRSRETIAYHQYYDFKLTESEARAWEAGRENLVDRGTPIENRRRWFMPSLDSEPRLCRYRSSMQWPPTVSFPFNAGFVARARLPIRHYPHRDPVQLERRCRLRAVMMADAENRSNWRGVKHHHWSQEDWHDFITPDDQPGLQRWEEGTDLPRLQYTNHLAKPHVRALQLLAHQMLLPALDATRQGWPEGVAPQPIPERIGKALETKLARP